MQQQDSAVRGCYRGHKDKWTQTGIGLIPEGETHQFLLQTACVPRMELHIFVQRIIHMEPVAAGDRSA